MISALLGLRTLLKVKILIVNSYLERQCDRDPSLLILSFSTKRGEPKHVVIPDFGSDGFSRRLIKDRLDDTNHEVSSSRLTKSKIQESKIRRGIRLIIAIVGQELTHSLDMILAACNLVMTYFADVVQKTFDPDNIIVKFCAEDKVL